MLIFWVTGPYGTAERLRSVDFGEPLHVLIVPGELHVMEREYLEAFAGL